MKKYRRVVSLADPLKDLLEMFKSDNAEEQEFRENTIRDIFS